MGRAALARGKLLSAGEHLQRAGVYYHFAKFLFVRDVAQMKEAHAKAVMCRTLALPHLAPPGERVAIPFAGKFLHAILRKPIGVARPPVMVMICGLDSCKEETGAYEQPYLARGIAVLVFDGPGQGEAEYEFPIRGDYETAVKAVIDNVETRHDIDAARIGLWGGEPGRLLRTARRGIRAAREGLHRAVGAVRLGRRMGRTARAHPGGVPGAQPLRHRGGRQAQRRNAFA